MENSKYQNNTNKEKKCMVWKKRTLLERYLSLVCLLFFVAFLVMIGILLHVKNINLKSSKKEICLSNICKHAAGSILSNMDLTIDPCENFYEFSCGSFLKYENIYDDEIRSFIQLQNYMIYFAKEQLEKPEDPYDPNFMNKVKKYYTSCLHKPSDLKEAVKEFLYVLQLDGWPLSESDNSKQTFEDALAMAIVYHGNGLLFRLDKSANNSFINMYEGRITIKSRGLLNATEERSIKMKANYLNLLKYVFSKLGLSSEMSSQYINEMIDFETSLAEIKEIERNDNATNITISELQFICPEIGWKKLFMFLFGYLDHPEEYNDDYLLEISSMEYIKNICELIGNTKNKRIIYNVLLWNIFIPEMARFDYDFFEMLLDMQYDLNIYHRMFRTFSGMKNLKWKNCIKDMDFYMQLGMDYTLIKSINPTEKILEVESYANQLSEIMNDIFSNVDWMDDYTKNFTKTKLKNIKYRVGYLNKSINTEFFEQLFENINVTSNYIENIFYLKKKETSDSWFNSIIETFFRYEDMLSRMKIDPFEVGASYGESGMLEGFIVISLGLMNPPFYAYKRPQYLNFGGIGFIIAHELGHGFDTLDFMMERSKEDENSTEKSENKRNSIKFSEEFLEEYKKRKNCFVNQYSNFLLQENLTINGHRTIRDNFADNNGILVAYKAYEKYLIKQGKEPNLPGLDFTNRQMFFIGYAQIWCEVIESMKKTYENDGHSPGKYRVLVPLMNLVEFSKVFNCPVNSYMNPADKCRVWE